MPTVRSPLGAWRSRVSSVTTRPHTKQLTVSVLDSVIESVGGTVLLRRLSVEAQGGGLERAERAGNLAAWLLA